MRKKILAIILLSLTLFLVACGGDEKDKTTNKTENTDKQNDANQEEGYFLWERDRIVGYSETGKKQTELVIPEKCSEVTSLSNNSKVKKIVFESDDTNIASGAFENCVALETISLPKNLKSIESSCFRGCSSLKEIIIPENVVEIEGDSFKDCTSLFKIELTDSILELGGSTFENCTNLKEITVPKNVVEIKAKTFYKCTSLSNVTFGTELKSIGHEAFSECDALTSVTLPEGVTTLESRAFAWCDSLKEIYLPSTIEKIKPYSLMPNKQVTVYVKEGSYMDDEGWTVLLGHSIDVYIKKYY